ncbi:transcription termination factor MTEF1, chloroplastic [Olea europaea var. sylvestris]|uniref:Transcription termination factor MTEF1, chloroplastic isoform X1 n=1 Tax=Olea europaea subsp. europaea TaxID=158383 RepID=A0A8S0UV63_OLEEU|nr:transcription termination factor MTEF1, chloroplastic [Olea europaea var. sylvestris]CAA3021755.1 transcription termination factor MTEF1, chloroplastic isoform X1 [Olea europaea subsp. europaea]
MPETLHLYATASSTTTAAAPFLNSPSIFRPKHLHFPSPPPKNEIPLSISPPPSPPIPTKSSQIQEKLLYLDSLGIDSLYCLHANPSLHSTSLLQLKSTVEFLFYLGLTAQNLRRIFPMCPEILTVPLSTTIIPATTFLLREAHVDAIDLRQVIRRRPRLLICCVDRQLRPTLYFLQGTIGIDDVSKCAPLLSCSVESKFIPRIEYLQKLGFSYKDTITMFRRFPSLFCYSIKENFEPKFDYFVVEMGRELKELVVFPQYFSFSLENRIKPRHKMCVEKGVCLALPTMLKSSEARFRDRLEVCCSSSMPN